MWCSTVQSRSIHSAEVTVGEVHIWEYKSEHRKMMELAPLVRESCTVISSAVAVLFCSLPISHHPIKCVVAQQSAIHRTWQSGSGIHRSYEQSHAGRTQHVGQEYEGGVDQRRDLTHMRDCYKRRYGTIRCNVRDEWKE